MPAGRQGKFHSNNSKALGVDEYVQKGLERYARELDKLCTKSEDLTDDELNKLDKMMGTMAKLKRVESEMTIEEIRTMTIDQINVLISYLVSERDGRPLVKDVSTKQVSVTQDLLPSDILVQPNLNQGPVTELGALRKKVGRPAGAQTKKKIT